MHTLPLILLALTGQAEPDIPPAAELHTTGRFDAALSEVITASFGSSGDRTIGLRYIVRRIADDRRISILTDRRLDPSRAMTVTVNNAPLADALKQIAASGGGETAIVANTVYLGPPQAAQTIRTLIRLRADELLAEDTDLPPGRHFDLAQRNTLQWDDLEAPRQVITDLATRYDLEVRNPERIPHDLWAAATLPSVTSWEALSLILIQFDLTFRWKSGGAAIEIIPIPPRVALEKRYPLADMQAAAKEVQAAAGELRGLEAREDGSEMVVRGTLEQHERLAQILRPGTESSAPRSSPADDPAPLSRRRFTLRIRNVPAAALIRKLEMSGIRFAWDAKALAAAGVKLDQPISMDVKMATPDEFFKAMCEPLGLEFQVDGTTVTLTPKSGGSS